jgi:hypothetical protein
VDEGSKNQEANGELDGARGEHERRRRLTGAEELPSGFGTAIDASLGSIAVLAEVCPNSVLRLLPDRLLDRLRLGVEGEIVVRVIGAFGDLLADQFLELRVVAAVHLSVHQWLSDWLSSGRCWPVPNRTFGCFVRETVVPKPGFEPGRGCPQRCLRPSRLPFRHFGLGERPKS